MSVAVALGSGRRLAPPERLLGTLCVLRARRLVRRHDVNRIAEHLDRVLATTCRPATLEQARWADEVVCSVRPRYRSGRAAVERSVAAALLCALRGRGVRWCWGARTSPPEATAWVEAHGQVVGAVDGIREAFPALLSAPFRGASGRG